MIDEKFNFSQTPLLGRGAAFLLHQSRDTSKPFYGVYCVYRDPDRGASAYDTKSVRRTLMGFEPSRFQTALGHKAVQGSGDRDSRLA